MLRYLKLIADTVKGVKEIMPWDLEERLQENPGLLIVDVREQHEFDAMHIPDSLCVPRGVLESACDWEYDETEPELVQARPREVVVVCRSGQRSIPAVYSLKILGFQNVVSLKTGLRGWNDYEQPLEDIDGNEVDPDDGDLFFTTKLLKDQMKPAGWAGY
jgi:rhodanese-related sulfurtransferase